MTSLATTIVKTPDTFAGLAAIEPRLIALERAVRRIARTHGRRDDWCAVQWWYEGPGNRSGLRRLMGRLVGLGVETPGVRSTKAWDIGRARLWNLLADCRHEAGGCYAGVEATIKTTVAALADELGVDLDPPTARTLPPGAVGERLDGTPIYGRPLTAATPIFTEPPRPIGPTTVDRLVADAVDRTVAAGQLPFYASGQDPAALARGLAPTLAQDGPYRSFVIERGLGGGGTIRRGGGSTGVRVR